MVAFLICLGGAIVSSLEHPLPALPFAVAGAVILMIPLAAFYRPKAQTAFRIDMHHLDERWGQLTLITLGESFLLFAEELTGVHEIPNLWLFFIVFVTIVAIWRLYFDSAMRRMGLRGGVIISSLTSRTPVITSPYSMPRAVSTIT